METQEIWWLLLAVFLGQTANTLAHITWNHLTEAKAHLGSIVLAFLIGIGVQQGISLWVLWQADVAWAIWKHPVTIQAIVERMENGQIRLLHYESTNRMTK